jgi:hypothetical protein
MLVSLGSVYPIAKLDLRDHIVSSPRRAKLHRPVNRRIGFQFTIDPLLL